MRLSFLLRPILLFLSFFSVPLFAQQSGDFIYSASAGTEVTITNYIGTGGAVTVPATIAGLPVTRIGTQAFVNKAGVTGVSFPASLTVIGSQSFYGCTGLTSVTFPNGVTTIADGAFAGCTGLTSISLGSGLSTLGSHAFNFCTALTSVVLPASLTTVGATAFLDCTSLTSVTFMGDAPTSFGTNVFLRVGPGFIIHTHAGKTGFTTPTWNGYTAIPIPYTYSIHSGAVAIDRYNGTATDLRVPATLAGLPVTHIGPEAFHSKTTLTRVVLPDSIVYIGWGAFANCQGLASINLGSSLATIDLSAFYDCAKLTSITFPATISNIQDAAFGRTGLTEAFFLGNAPATFGANVFHTTPAGFTIFYYEGSTGFTSPTWKGYPAVRLGGVHGSIEAWRSRYFGTTQNTGAAADDQDPDGDGISNLLEFAFNLHPQSRDTRTVEAATGKLGLPLTTVVTDSGGKRLKVEFVRRKTVTNLSYAVEFSSDLKAGTWTTGFAFSLQSAINDDWDRVVLTSTPSTEPRRFARVRVTRVAP